MRTCCTHSNTSLTYVWLWVAGRQLLEDEETEYAAMTAETIYILQGSLSLEVASTAFVGALGSALCTSVRQCVDLQLAASF
jgi:hypothetical protein